MEPDDGVVVDDVRVEDKEVDCEELVDVPVVVDNGAEVLSVDSGVIEVKDVWLVEVDV